MTECTCVCLMLTCFPAPQRAANNIFEVEGRICETARELVRRGQWKSERSSWRGEERDDSKLYALSGTVFVNSVSHYRPIYARCAGGVQCWGQVIS